VLSLIAAGMSNREIAGHLVVSEGTVNGHVNHLLAKIDARDRAQAVTFACQRGLPSAGAFRRKPPASSPTRATGPRQSRLSSRPSGPPSQHWPSTVPGPTAIYLCRQ
jgi:hypothetical protein